MKVNPIYFAYISALINAIIVGLSFLFTKTAITLSNPLDTLAFRFMVSFLVLSLPVILGYIKIEFNLQRLKKLLPLTIFYPALFFSFQAFGLKYSPSSEGGMIFATTPIITTILASYFLKEKTSLLQKFSIILSVTGVVFIFIMKGSTIEAEDILGITLLVISCLSISGYSVLARSLTKTFKPMEITYFMLAIGFLLFTSMAVVSHIRANTLPSFFSPWSNPQFVVSIVFLGILASLVTSLLSNYILSKIPASQMSVFSNLSTVISIIAGAAFMGEMVYSYHIVGALMIILGVLGTNLLRDPSRLKLKRLKHTKAS